MELMVRTRYIVSLLSRFTCRLWSEFRDGGLPRLSVYGLWLPGGAGVAHGLLHSLWQVLCDPRMMLVKSWLEKADNVINR